MADSLDAAAVGNIGSIFGYQEHLYGIEQRIYRIGRKLFDVFGKLFVTEHSNNPPFLQ